MMDYPNVIGLVWELCPPRHPSAGLNLSELIGLNPLRLGYRMTIQENTFARSLSEYPHILNSLVMVFRVLPFFVDLQRVVGSMKIISASKPMSKPIAICSNISL